MAPTQAQSLLAKAEKKFSSSTGWFSSSTSKYEEAGDLFEQAANAFKLEKLFKEAGDAFVREADCRDKGGEKDQAANAWWNAAKSFARYSIRRDIQTVTSIASLLASSYLYDYLIAVAVRSLGTTITYLTQLGRFRQAADREKEIAGIYLHELNDIKKACESFERAGDWYEQEDAKATANACYKDAADLRAELDQFQKAIDLYERVADHSLQSPLTKYSVKEYWLRAGLCALAMQDPVTASRNLAKYGTSDVTFPSTREAKFLNELLKAVDEGNQEDYTAAVVGFDQVTKLDNWKTSILLKIKKGIQDEPGLT